MSVTRRCVTLATVALIGLAVAGCFDKEPKQRASFIEFLQKRVIDRPGLKIPIVKDEDYAAMGPYAVHYGVIRRFHATLDESISKDLMKAVQAGRINSLPELMNRRQDLATIRDGMAKLRAGLDKAEADAVAERAKLTQPKDLETVYAVAFDKMVTVPARTMRQTMPPLEGTLQTAQELGGYLQANQAKIAFRGSTMESNDPEVRRRLGQFLQTLTEKSSQLDAAQQQLRRLADGR